MVSVILPTYREKNSIRGVIEEFFATGFVDEVLVVHHSAEPGTEEEVKKTKARIIHGPKQHFGYSAQTGMLAARGDYIIICEPDATYTARDLEKLLVFGKDLPVVFGTRTSRFTILSGAAMGYWRKWANVLEAKVIEVLFNTTTLSDVGCNYRLLRREAVERVKSQWREGGAIFTLEMMLLVVREGIPFVEIPVTYRPRVGESTGTAHWYQLVKWAFLFLFFIFGSWFRWLKKKSV
ncbi:MAG: hypothetical protein A2751_03200 [Candidatus Doudnabacteria bacterium RIFCSPHIGHO2_01_FULL_46_14]|uniref:Glycosyltransferase 2-like domain-containing protein n=1 Tax=Candidatus Doudnabacteria bacterium RIFCSPHIGHO2_01_FULL_46_14 TaxID=1817824 RepID=A0A1F5NKR9_9BACT|nr:MAG: hypothetical protein A2751_03200 [Candidatus Doudnabacteria bacterium RIFCSPHIGHO2_01_FULL_46_14]